MHWLWVCLILPITYLWKLIKICFSGWVFVFQKNFQQARLKGNIVRYAEIFKKNVFFMARAWISGRLSGSQHEGVLGCEMSQYHVCASFLSKTLAWNLSFHLLSISLPSSDLCKLLVERVHIKGTDLTLTILSLIWVSIRQEKVIC